MSANKSIAWFVLETSVENPVRKRYRVTLLPNNYFRYKGVTYFLMKSGVARSTVDGGVLGKGRIHKTDKLRMEEYVEAECRRACDPNSELYWAM